MIDNASIFLQITEYFYLFKFSLIALIISLLLLSLSVFFVYQKPDKEKISVYECGFHPYGDARNKFEVKFYIVGILFIIFDLEIMYIFSWIIGIWHLHYGALIVMFLFIGLLTVGFIYELFLGAIDLHYVIACYYGRWYNWLSRFVNYTYKLIRRRR